MLYFIHGNDLDKAHSTIDKIVHAAQQKKGAAEVFSYTDETFDEPALPELLHGQGLFEAKQIVVLRRAMERAETKEVLYAARKELAASPNLFVIFEAALDAKTKRGLETVAEKTWDCDRSKPNSVAPKGFNRFSLADALVAGDKQKLWVLYQKAKLDSAADEEIHGILFWQARAIVLAKQYRSAAEAGLKPFVYQKSKQAKLTLNDAKDAARELLKLYQEARRGRFELGEGLERFILGQ